MYTHGLGDIWLHHKADSFRPSKNINQVNLYHCKIKQRLIDCHNQSLISELNDYSKMRTYVQFKNENKIEEYLINTTNTYSKKLIAKLRLSNHLLKIETGRYDRIPLKDRLCLECSVIEDEYHLLIKCKKNHLERNNLFENIETKI